MMYKTNFSSEREANNRRLSCDVIDALNTISIRLEYYLEYL